MTPLIQTDTEHGNCWQTATACVLDQDPETLPDQVAIEGPGRKHRSYGNALLAYLAEHHGLHRSSFSRHQIQGIQVTAFEGHHMMVGPTVRTAENNLHHIVVARNGETVWDPHPSQAGILYTNGWEVLAPLPLDLLAEWRGRRDLRSGPIDALLCQCPACGGPLDLR